MTIQQTYAKEEIISGEIMAKVRFTNPSVVGISKLALREARAPKPDPTEIKTKAELDNARNAANLQTPEADQHAKYSVKVGKDGKRRAYNATGSNLDYYLRKRQITVDQHTAANRFHDDFYNSRMAGNIKSCLDITIGGKGGVNKAGLNFQAWESYRGAVDKLHVRYRKITIYVCCHGEWLSDIKSDVPSYRRMDALQRGLSALVLYYNRKLSASRIMTSFHASVTTTMGDINNP